MKGPLSVAALLLVCGLLLSGCGLMQPPQTYMRLPKLPAQEAELMERVLANLPSDAAILRPRKSTQASMLPIRDMNGDGRDEAVVFYKLKESNDQIAGEIWSRSDAGWEKMTTIQGEGYDLDMLRLVDLLPGGKPALVVGYVAGSQNGLSIYAFEGGELKRLFQTPYNELVIDDMNEDGQQDLTIFTRSRERNQIGGSAVLYQYEQEAFAKKGSTEMDPFVNAYYTVMVGQAMPGRKSIVLDGGVGAHSSYTQLIIWEKGNLKAVFPDASNPTFRAYSAVSSDVNEDGVIDIPLMLTPPGWEGKAMVEMQWIYAYMNWDGGTGLTYVMERYISNAQGFYFDVPKEWKGTYTFEPQAQSIRFVAVHDRKTLAEIRYVPIDKWKEGAEPGWTPLVRTSTTVYAVNTDSYDMARNAFHLVTESPELAEEGKP
ncbi:hypothetical protein [Paenibacillus koleovorans]|uniref:hypothetical protein n=1 Tax=Paenibacillus koleovorans TaxID=121608 RepID=UPI000FD764A4|nr:hypothetical protein [Paenibacillus koleovorans]